MYKITETYKDYNDVERTEDFYFNLSKAELTKLELRQDGGLVNMLQTLVKKKDIKDMINVFEMILDTSYGRKSDDGRKFVKNAEILDDFKSTEAYSQIFTRFATDEKFAAELVNGIIPKDLQEEVSKMSEEDKKKLLDGMNVPSVK